MTIMIIVKLTGNAMVKPLLNSLICNLGIAKPNRVINL